VSALHEQKILWIAAKELGQIRTLRHRGRRLQYRLPAAAAEEVILRFSGLGKTRGGETGDLLLKVRVDRGQEEQAALWISEEQARRGTDQTLRHHWHSIPMQVPPGAVAGQELRLAGLGRKLPFRWGMRWFSRSIGDLVVKLNTFPDRVTPSYRSWESLTTADLALEGWVYRRVDLVLEKMRHFRLDRVPMSALQLAEAFNQGGWRKVATLFIEHLELRSAPITFVTSPSLAVPGQCQRSIQTRNGAPVRVMEYRISLREEFLSDPFAVGAILAHELCHVVEALHLAPAPWAKTNSESERTEMEQTVDLLVFMAGLGEFQMRVARNQRITLGYFSQDMFERMQAILARKRAPQTPGRP
jgi:hypothetical protein